MLPGMSARMRLPGGAALVLALAAAAIGAAGCGRGDRDLARDELPLRSETLRTPDALEARGVLERFLHALAAGDYATAAADFSGDLKRLQDLNPLVAPDDVPELFEKYCSRHRGACLPARVVAGRVAGPGGYEFLVELLGEDDAPVAIGDPLLPQSQIRRIPFRVQRIGIRFYVLDLPPQLP